MKDKEFWKAREWENWILYYSTIILHFFLDKRYVLHWIKLVEALYILLQSEIGIDELDQADPLIHEFVTETQHLYSKVAMSYNVHILLHLAKSVLNWGPLFAHSAFGFESGNCELLKVIHAAKGVHYQVCRHINLHYSYNILKKRIFANASSDVQHFCTQLGTSMLENTMKLSNSRYFGISSNVNVVWAENLNLSHRARSYKKLVKAGCLYVSSTKYNKRSDNAFAKLNNGSYVRIMEFIVDPEFRQEFTICHKLQTRPAFRGKQKNLQKVTSIIVNETAIPTANIHVVCVHMKIRNEEYICAVPNHCSY